MFSGMNTSDFQISGDVTLAKKMAGNASAGKKGLAAITRNTLAATTTITRNRQSSLSGSVSDAISTPANEPALTLDQSIVDIAGCAPLSDKEAAAVDAYEPHGLADLKNASLMNRVDSKFVIPRGYLTGLLQFMQDKYTALEISDLRASRYYNCYYDTDQYTHYLAHHNRRANRFKLRQRTYRDSNTSFLEIKFRNNRRRTIKTRVPLAGDRPVINTETRAFIEASGMYEFGELNAKQIGTYTRIALANEAAAERITIDVDLAVKDIQTGKMHEIGDWVIVEVKQSEFNRHSPFFDWASQQGLRRCSFSKYCMGLYYTGPEELKRNNFHKIDRQMAVSEKRYARRLSLKSLWPDMSSGLIGINP